MKGKKKNCHLLADVGQLLVDGTAVVVQARRLQDDARGADHHRHGEDPEEQAVENHRHVFPVLFRLRGNKGHEKSLRWGIYFAAVRQSQLRERALKRDLREKLGLCSYQNSHEILDFAGSKNLIYW